MRISYPSLKQVDAILIADLHIREDQPLCRTDNYWEAQEKKMRFICALQKKYVCPVLIAGDLFDYWKPSPFLLTWCLRNFPDNVYAIPGQHDLPEHSLELVGKSGITTLLAAESDLREFCLLIGNDADLDLGAPCVGFPWKSPLRKCKKEDKNSSGRAVALVHTLVFPGKRSNLPGAIGVGELVEQMPGFDLIVVGDNHQPFVEKVGECLVVSPGSMMRMTADQIDHKPRVYLWNAEENAVEPYFFPIEQGVVSREHIEEEKAKEGRLEAYKARLQSNMDVHLDFENNLETYIHENNVEKTVEKTVYAAMERE